MKTSNIILTSIIASITLLVITAAVSIRLTGDKDSRKIISKTTTLDLPHFEYVSVKDVKQSLSIISGSKGSLNLDLLNGAPLPHFDHEVRGDTLFLSNLNRGPAIITLTIPYDTEIIVGKNSTIRIGDVTQQSMFFNLEKSNLTISKNAHLRDLEVRASDKSNIHVFTAHLNKLGLNLVNSQVYAQTTVDNLKGFMHDKSRLDVKNVNNFDFEKDKTSRLHHWQ